MWTIPAGWRKPTERCGRYLDCTASAGPRVGDISLSGDLLAARFLEFARSIFRNFQICDFSDFESRFFDFSDFGFLRLSIFDRWIFADFRTNDLIERNRDREAQTGRF